EDVDPGQLPPHRNPLLQLDGFEYPGIPYINVRAFDDAFGGVAEQPRSRRAERGGIEPMAHGALIVWQVRIVQKIRPYGHVGRSRTGCESGARWIGTCPKRR